RPDGLADNFGLREGVYHLSPEQAKAILEMRLQKLTGLEQDKLVMDYQELLDKIRELMAILADTEKLLEVIRDELRNVRNEYGDARRTEILTSKEDFSIEDLI